MTAQDEFEAILTALNAALAPKVAYDADEVPTPRPEDYVEVTLTRRFGGQERSARKGATGWRVSTRAVSRYVANAREMHAATETALEYMRPTVGGKPATPIQFESEVAVGEKDGWFSGIRSWTYTRTA